MPFSLVIESEISLDVFDAHSFDRMQLLQLLYVLQYFYSCSGNCEPTIVVFLQHVFHKDWLTEPPWFSEALFQNKKDISEIGDKINYN